ncbi:MAG: hypothetical protein IH996_05295 [Proteobacteria bacterium]|nr:hypothetical protein [Pseudomonadota bacterium]
MPKSITTYQIFLVGPGDVDAEKTAAEKVVKQWNSSIGKVIGARLEILNWKPDVPPGAADDAQQVINEHISDDYDILLLIVWHRIGTETENAVSGTVEEYGRAIERFKSDPKSVRVMVYFKTANPPYSDLDPTQFEAVKAFKKQVSADGVLYKEFEDTAQFSEFLFIHLSLILGDPPTQPDDESRAAPAVYYQTEQPALVTEDESEDLGFLDFIEGHQQASAEFVEAMKDIQDGIVKLGQDMKREADLAAAHVVAIPSSLARQISDRLASSFDEFSDKYQSSESDIFDSYLSMADNTNGLVNLLLESPEFVDLEELRDFKETLVGLRDTTDESMNSVEGLAKNIAALPRLKKEFNKGKRKLVSNLQSFTSEIRRIDLYIADAIQNIDLILSKDAT